MGPSAVYRFDDGLEKHAADRGCTFRQHLRGIGGATEEWQGMQGSADPGLAARADPAGDFDRAPRAAALEPSCSIQEDDPDQGCLETTHSTNRCRAGEAL